MGEFNTQIDWKIIDDRARLRRLNEPLQYILDDDQAAELLREFNALPQEKLDQYENKTWTAITAPGGPEGEGFETDGGSVPRFLWWFASPFTGRAVRGYVIHDWLCKNKICSRALGDRIARRCWEDLEVPWWKRHPLYAGIRAFAIATGLK